MHNAGNVRQAVCGVVHIASRVVEITSMHA